MPDHCHWVLRLGARLQLSRLAGKFKPLSQRANSQLGHPLWQRNFFERQLRPTDSAEKYALYVFLNPYRAGSVSRADPWPYWWTNAPAELGFIEHLDRNGSPPAEWLNLKEPPELEGHAG